MHAAHDPRVGVRRYPDKPMSGHAAHDWWYRCLATAGIVAPGTTSGERMHKSRHTAGQRVLDATGNLKAVQKLLGHASIQTTGDIYADWDIDQLAATMADVLAADDEDESAPKSSDSQSFPPPRRKNQRFAAETRNQWTLGKEDQTVKPGSRLCAKPWQRLRQSELEVFWAGLCRQLQPKLAVCLIKKPADVDQGQADEIAVLVKADGVPFGRLVEVNRARGIALGKVEHVRVMVVADTVERVWADVDGHGLLLLGNAVRMLPTESSPKATTTLSHRLGPASRR